MPKLKLDIVTAERVVYSMDEVDMVVAPGVEGQMGILPHHAPLMTMLQAGELRIKQGGEETSLAIFGGFLEVRPDKVVILADVAERAEEIDMAKAEEAKKAAEEAMRRGRTPLELAQAEAELRRALTEIKVAEKSRRKVKRPPA